MDNAEIIKRRLVQLKKMSIQLKQSTQNTNQVDFSIVYGILQATKSSASKMTQIPLSTPKSQNRSDSPLSKLLAMSSPKSQPYRSLFPQNANREMQNSHKGNSKGSEIKINSNTQIYSGRGVYQDYYIGSPQQQFQQQANQFIGTLGEQNGQNAVYHPQSYPHHSQTEQQVISLRQQNTHLQRAILNLRTQLQDLKQKFQTVSLQQQWKSGLPYFKLNGKIQAFYTRLKISEHDYQKIQYVNYQAQLTLDKIAIKKSSGMGAPKQLDLTQLCEVHYIDSIVMLLHFGVMNTDDKNIRSSGKQQTNKSDIHSKHSNQQFLQNIFIKFNNEEQLHRWDLALFINFKIVESLKKDKLFTMSGARSRSKSRKRSSQSRNLDSHKKSKRSSDHTYQDDQDLMKRLIERRDLYLQTKKMVSQRMIQKVNQKKNGHPPQLKKQKQIDFDDVQEFSETHPFEIKDESLVNRSIFSNVMRDEDNLQISGQKNERANTSKFKDLNSGQNSLNLNNVDNIIIPNLNIGGNQRDLSFNPDNFQLSLSRKLEQERIKQANEVRSQSQIKNKKIQEILKKFTNQGYDLTKYAKDGFNPHDKRVFLSQDLKKFCWQEEGGKDKKQIDMKSIKQIQVEKIGQGIRKHIKKPKKQEHCIISYVKDNKLKVIQLGANSTVMAQFVEEFQTIKQYLVEKWQKQKGN